MFQTADRSRVVTALVILAAAAAAVTAWVLLSPNPTGNEGSGLSGEFAYSAERFRHVDPELIRWRQAAAVETGFDQPRGIAIERDADGERLLVVGDAAIAVFDADGKRIETIELDARPRCVAVSADGTRFLGFADHVETLSADGERTSWAPLDGEPVITSIAPTDEAVYVADAGNRRVLICNRDGEIVGRLGDRDTKLGSPGIVVRSPHLDVAAGTDGLIRVANCGRWRVETYTPDGMLELSWGESGMEPIEAFCGCCNPADIAVFDDGRIATSEKGIPRVKVYDAHGEMLGVVASADVFGGPGDPIPDGLDLAIDANGRIYVLDPVAKIVRIFERKETP